jgi:diaminopimelate decarboxylase
LPEGTYRKLHEIQKRGHRLYGVAFHTGSSYAGSCANYAGAIDRALQIMQIGRETLQHPMNILDIGGG